MFSKNFERMIQLATETFEVNNDPQQLDVDEKIIEQLKRLHPNAVSEMANEDGPYIWVLVIPTNKNLMNKFINGEISETELLNQTPMDIQYDALYLCSAMTLEEYRGKGTTREITLNAINEIRKTHSINALFVWNFSQEGSWLANSISLRTDLPLLERARD